MASRRVAVALFLRLLALVYLFAFGSFGWQVRGLIGEEGILPAAPFLQAVARSTGLERLWLLPTVFWLDASDATLQAVPVLGAFAAVALLAGVRPAPLLAPLWVLWVSLLTVGREFLGYQWDALLAEAGLLAIFLVPLRGAGPPRSAAVWALRFLLFRLMLGSGIVKLASGDRAWRSLTALSFHYETQPLPTPLGWVAHQLPAWFQQASAAAMFGIELVLPLLIFGPRRCRHAAAAGFLLLQALIAATGNYAFFNLLTVALCVLLLEDRDLPARFQVPEPALQPPTRPWLAWGLASLYLVVALVHFSYGIGVRVPWPRPVLAVARHLAPLRSVNSYGLFAVMTTRRPEILVEGSRDGADWRPYEFVAKPGDPLRRPVFVAPHQPRLDWQMWFAALGPCEGAPWLQSLLRRLHAGSPAVLGLLAGNPFPDAPPRFLRTRLYDYRFTDVATLRADGRWWRREAVGDFCPAIGGP